MSCTFFPLPSSYGLSKTLSRLAPGQINGPQSACMLEGTSFTFDLPATISSILHT